MRPTLFNFFGFPVPSYAVLMILGYVFALGAVGLLARRSTRGQGPAGLDRAQTFDLYIVMVVSSILGSKIAHTLFEAKGHLDEHGHPIDGVVDLLKNDPWHWARLGEGGYVWYGGLIGALLTALVYFRRRPRLNAWLYADAFTPAIMLGAVVGRLGCFLARCCYGRPTDGPFGVRFPGMAEPVHPTQLYDSAAALVLFVAFWLRFPRRRFDGENVCLLLIAYPVLRFLTESVRGDADRGSFGPLSTSQWISLLFFVVGAALFAWRQRAGARTSPAHVAVEAEG